MEKTLTCKIGKIFYLFDEWKLIENVWTRQLIAISDKENNLLNKYDKYGFLPTDNYKIKLVILQTLNKCKSLYFSLSECEPEVYLDFVLYYSRRKFDIYVETHEFDKAKEKCDRYCNIITNLRAFI